MRMTEAEKRAKKRAAKREESRKEAAKVQAEIRAFFAKRNAAKLAMKARFEARDREYAAWQAANGIKPKRVINRDGTVTEIRGQEVTGVKRVVGVRTGAYVADTLGEGAAIFAMADAAKRGIVSVKTALTREQRRTRESARRMAEYQARKARRIAERKAKRGGAK